ncbi:MAG: hypothetical protein K8T90_20410 [Planctomycetes bacterium]|nr:hypothetical protein [Planctomycetota bacterium]
MTVRPLAVLLLSLEAALGLVWTCVITSRPDLGSAFLPKSVPADLVRTFILADLVFYAALPAAAAFGLRRGRPWASAVLWTHIGGVAYAALLGWGTVLVTGDGLVGAALMTPSAAVLPWIAVRLGRGASGAT